MKSPTHVVGLLFSADLSTVVLIRKARPPWQAGLLNGVGGKIDFRAPSGKDDHEYDRTGTCVRCSHDSFSSTTSCARIPETPAETMARESREETGYAGQVAWRFFCRYDSPQHESVVDFFCAADDAACYQSRTTDDTEPLERVGVKTIGNITSRFQMFGSGLIPNLLWFIPMALNLLSGRSSDTFQVLETT